MGTKDGRTNQELNGDIAMSTELEKSSLCEYRTIKSPDMHKVFIHSLFITY